MVVSLRDDFEMISIVDCIVFAPIFYIIPKGFLNCQFSIVNCQLKMPGGEWAVFIRQLKRRAKSHAVFHMQDSREAMQGDILVWNRGMRNALTEIISV